MMLGIDTGGTYTDAVLFDPSEGVRAAAKALTTKHDLAIGVKGAVDAVMPSPAPPIELVCLSTTLATNAIVEGHGSPVGLILIGQREAALDRAGLREALGGDPVAFIKGGHRADGSELEPLDLAAAKEAIMSAASRVSAFAVAGYFAVRNAAHEQAVRELVRELTGLPVTCSHELSSNLDAPRRAMTAVLNARLIPLLQELILVVEEMLATRGIHAPLMVVMGDGSLIEASSALTRPVETILSGPAASVVGARYLSQRDEGFVVDIGGTTTDIAVIRDGWPALRSDGARVGGWHTMVEAIDVQTFGLGGDSEVCLLADGALTLGPRRVVPLSLFGTEYPPALPILDAQLARGARTYDGSFVMRQRHRDRHPGPMTMGEARLWESLGRGPVALERLMADHPQERPLERLVRRGLVSIAAFTPTDAAHVLGWHRPWSTGAAELGAKLGARGSGREADGAEGFSRAVVEQLVRQSGEAVIEAGLRDRYGRGLEGQSSMARLLIKDALARTGDPLLDAAEWSLSFELRRPLIAIGAPAAAYYPQVAERLHCELVVPPFAHVCNAVGAVASSVMQVAKVLITAPQEGRYRVHSREGIRDFDDLERAAEHAKEVAARLADQRARAAGASHPDLELERRDRSAPLFGGQEIFLESEIVARASGRPRSGRAPG